MSVSSYTTNESLVEDVKPSLEGHQDQFVYETQYFGFTPKSFSNGMYNAVIEYMREGLEAVESYINTEYGQVMSQEQVSEGITKMQQKMARQVDKAFDILEVYLFTNIFCIPENSVLPEDTVKQERRYTDDDEKKLLAEIKEYEEKILAVKYANTCLQKELGDIDQAQKMMDVMLSRAQDMNQMVKKAGVTDVKDSLVFAITQTQKRLDVLKQISFVSNSQQESTKEDEGS